MHKPKKTTESHRAVWMAWWGKGGNRAVRGQAAESMGREQRKLEEGGKQHTTAVSSGGR